MLEQLPDASRYDIRILGTDIDPVMIQTGQEAIYGGIGEDQMPMALRQKYFATNRSSPDLCAVPGLRNLVTFAELNLMQKWPMRGLFDVIFCRNVVIYFDVETQQRLWPRFVAAMAPGGFLFVGHSERVSGHAEEHLSPVGVTQYRRN